MKLFALIKKEFLRFFRDPRLILTMLLPGILIYIIYSVMGGVMNAPEKETYEYRAYVSGSSAVVEPLIQTAVGTEGWEFLRAEDVDAAKAEVKDGKAAALVVFSENFDERVAAYTPASGGPAPQVEIYYRSADGESSSFYALVTAVLDGYENALSNKFDVNAGSGYDFSDAGRVLLSIMGNVLPFIVIALIFSSCMGVTLEAVAGEKERGTLSTILVTSVRRSDVALGKVLPLSCISLIGAVSSFLGIALSLPKLMGISFGDFAAGFGFAGYSLLFLLIVSIVPLIVAGVSAVSAYAKSVKEASAYTSVVMIVVMLLSLASSFVSGIGDWIVVVPILNAVVAMQAAIAGAPVVWTSLTSVALNLVYTALLVLLIAKMLSSEKIMFGK